MSHSASLSTPDCRRDQMTSGKPTEPSKGMLRRDGCSVARKQSTSSPTQCGCDRKLKGATPSTINATKWRRSRSRATPGRRMRQLLSSSRRTGSAALGHLAHIPAYAPGPEPHRESDPLDLAAVGSRAVSVRGIAALEYWTLNSPAWRFAMASFTARATASMQPRARSPPCRCCRLRHLPQHRQGRTRHLQHCRAQ